VPIKFLTSPQGLIEAEKIRLNQNDGEFVLKWVDQLRTTGEILAFKSSADPAPVGSGLASGTFVLMIQTQYQKQSFEKYGPAFTEIDATDNTTHYENTSLFTVMVKDYWGHGQFNGFISRGA
jgi:hypothetical protein